MLSGPPRLKDAYLSAGLIHITIKQLAVACVCKVLGETHRETVQFVAINFTCLMDTVLLVRLIVYITQPQSNVHASQAS